MILIYFPLTIIAFLLLFVAVELLADYLERNKDAEQATLVLRKVENEP